MASINSNDMRKRKNIFYFLLIIAIVQFVCQWAYTAIYSIPTFRNFSFVYLVNLPFSILVGIVDFAIINTSYKVLKLKDNGVRILVDIIVSSIFILLLAFLLNDIFADLPAQDFFTKRATLLIIWNIIVTLLIEIFFYNQRQVEAEKRLTEVEKEKMRYQYETLKAQLNPHFLFNSLNVISSLAYRDPEKTNLFAKKMSGVYRYLLITNERPFVSLSEELAFVDSYIFLEKIRFDGGLEIEISQDTNTSLNQSVIPLSLQLLVENAIKHNTTTLNSPLKINIHIGDKNVVVTNNLQLRTSVEKGGIGLKNLQTQYGLYNKSITIKKTDQQYTVTVPYIEVV